MAYRSRSSPGSHRHVRRRLWARGKSGLRALALPVFIALMLLLPGGLASAQTAGGNAPNPLTVSGDGTATLPPDQAIVSASVDTKAQGASDALNQNSQTLNAVIAAVEAAGIPDSSVNTTGLQVSPQTQAGVTSGYQAHTGITVKTTDLSGVGDLVQTMISAGVTSVDGVAYGLQNPEQLPEQALQAATANAQQQAQAIAAALGLTLGAPVNFIAQPGLSEPQPIPAPAPPPSNGSATAPVLPGPFSVSAHVTVTYSVQAQ